MDINGQTTLQWFSFPTLKQVQMVTCWVWNWQVYHCIQKTKTTKLQSPYWLSIPKEFFGMKHQVNLNPSIDYRRAMTTVNLSEFDTDIWNYHADMLRWFGANRISRHFDCVYHYNLIWFVMFTPRINFHLRILSEFKPAETVQFWLLDRSNQKPTDFCYKMTNLWHFYAIAES